MVGSEWPKVREIGVDVGWRPNIFEAVVFCHFATFDIIFREDYDVLKLMAEMLVGSMRLNELAYIDLMSQVSRLKQTKDTTRRNGMEAGESEGREYTGTPSLSDNSAVRSRSSFPPPFVSWMYGIFLCSKIFNALCAAGIGFFPSIRTP